MIPKCKIRVIRPRDRWVWKQMCLLDLASRDPHQTPQRLDYIQSYSLSSKSMFHAKFAQTATHLNEAGRIACCSVKRPFYNTPGRVSMRIAKLQLRSI